MINGEIEMLSLVKYGNDELPYDIKSFLDEIGVRETITIIKEDVPRIEYDIWLPSCKGEEPPF